MARLGEVTPESAELDSLVSEKLAEAPPRKAKKTKSAAAVLKIRRVSGISAAGRMLVKDTDLYDEIEVDDTDTLLRGSAKLLPDSRCRRGPQQLGDQGFGVGQMH